MNPGADRGGGRGIIIIFQFHYISISLAYATKTRNEVDYELAHKYGSVSWRIVINELYHDAYCYLIPIPSLHSSAPILSRFSGELRFSFRSRTRIETSILFLLVLKILSWISESSVINYYRNFNFDFRLWSLGRLVISLFISAPQWKRKTEETGKLNTTS